MKILIRIILVILLLLALFGVLSVTPFGQGIFGGDAARQACIDHMKKQAAKGHPIPYAEQLELWAEQESRNLYAEPEIFNYLTKYETSSATERESMLELAADRLLRGMEDCDTVSIVPVAIEYMKTNEVYFESAKSSMELWERVLEKIDQMIADGDSDQATTALIHLHDILAHQNNHSTGLLGMTVDVLRSQLVFDHTLKLIDSGKIQPSDDQLARFSFLASKINWPGSWSNAILFERGLVIGLIDGSAKPTHIPWWKVHRRFRYSETVYKATLEGWRTLEISADLPTSGTLTWEDLNKANLKAQKYAKSPALSRPNRFLDDEWGMIELSIMGSGGWLLGLMRSILQVDAYQALLAAHQIKLTSGSFPKTLAEIPTELLPADCAKRLAEAKATLNINENKPPTISFQLPDGTSDTFPREAENGA